MIVGGRFLPMNDPEHPKSQIDFDSFPSYTPDHFRRMMGELTPVEEFHGVRAKRDDKFSLGGVRGGKVRQCLTLVHDRLDQGEDIKGLCVGVGLPSPQAAITSAVAKYFGLSCGVVVPKYKPEAYDFNRINASLAQKFGAQVYGSGNTRLSGVEKLARDLAKYFNYYYVKFGFEGDRATDVIADQVENLPEDVTDVVVVGGSGLSAIGILKGLRRFSKGVQRVWVVYLSGYFERSMKRWYYSLPKDKRFQGEVIPVESEKDYQELYNPLDFDIDLTYESKAWFEMQKLLTGGKIDSAKTLFWIVGIREYDMELIEPINWYDPPDFDEMVESLRLF